MRVAVDLFSGRPISLPDSLTTVSLADLGTGTLDATTVLHGNGTWSVPYILGLKDGTDATKQGVFDLSNLTTATTRTVNIPDANSTTAQAKAVVASNWLTGMTAQGVFSAAQPTFADLAAHPSTVTGYGITDAQPIINYAGAKIIHVSQGAAATDTRTGLSVYDATKPFATLAAAKAAASSGDTIWVDPGSYTENDLAKDGVNWHFAQGASVTYSGASAVGIFDDYAGASTFRISGAGKFYYNSTHATTGAGVLYMTNSASDWDISADTISNNVSASANGGAVIQTAGAIRVRAFQILCPAVGGLTAGIEWNGGEMHIDVQLLKTNRYMLWGTATASSSPQTACFVRANYMSGSQILFTGDSSAQVWLDVLEIDATSTPSVGFSAVDSSGVKFYLNAQKVYANCNSSAGKAALKVANAWVHVMKVTQLGTGYGAIFAGSVHGVVDQIEDAGATSITNLLISGTSGTTDVSVKDITVTNPSGIGVSYTASGTAVTNLRDTVINASLATSGNPLKVTQSGLSLSNVKLIAATGQDSIYATAAKTVTRAGTIYANNPVNSNIIVTPSGSDLGSSIDASVYSNNAAAIAGGLTAGKPYRTGADPDVVCVVH